MVNGVHVTEEISIKHIRLLMQLAGHIAQEMVTLVSTVLRAAYY